MNKKKSFLQGLIIVFIIFIFLILETHLVNGFGDNLNFEVDNSLLKFSLKQEESTIKNITVNNFDQKIDFKIDINLDFIQISEKEFSLNPEESKILEINFNISGKDPGVYVGKIVISENKNSLEIPVVLEIETDEVLFDASISVPPEYSNVYAGEKLVVDNKIFNLENIGYKTIGIDYIIKDLDGRTIFSEQENIAVETQILITKVIPIPENIKEGNYVFLTTIKYSDSVGTSSYFFNIDKKKLNLIGENSIMWIAFSLLLLIFLLILYNIRQRDKMFLELQKQYRKALKLEFEKERNEGKKTIKLKPIKRKLELKKIRRKRKTKLKAIKIIHKRRVREIRKLKKQKKKSEIRNKVDQWKKQGYDTSILESKIKIKPGLLNLKEMKKKIGSWRSKGYNTGVLKK